MTSDPDAAVREALDALRAADLAHLRADPPTPEHNAAGNTAGLSERARPFSFVEGDA